MYPDLSYLFHDIFGTSQDNWTSIFKTFGLFLALAFVASGYLLYIELKRKEAEGLLHPIKIKEIQGKGLQISDLLLNFAFWTFLTSKILFIISDFQAFQIDPAGILLSLKGNWGIGLLIGFLVTGYRYYSFSKSKTAVPKEVEKLLYPHQRIVDITFIAAIAGVLGSRLFSILENLNDFLKDPVGQLFSGSGLTIYGGLILAFIVVYWYVKKKGIPPIHIMDAVAPALIVGYAVGRIGCQLAGDGDWGIVNEMAKPSWFFFPDWGWAYDYPHNVADTMQRGTIIEGCKAKFCTRLPQPVFPTPIYEVIASFGIFAILWSIRKRIKIAGVLFFIYLTLNGLERFFIEFIRVNPRYEILGTNLSQAQYIALSFIVGGLIGIYVLIRKSKKSIGN